MKKFVAGAVGAVMMSAGLVASAGTAAHADPYPPTVATTTTAFVAKKVKQNRSANVCGTVTVTSGSGTPVGTVTFKVKRGKFSLSKSFGYAGGKICYRTGKLKKTGKYKVKVIFDAKPGTVYKDSSDSASFKVVKPQR